MERWRQPIIPLEVVDHDTSVSVIGNREVKNCRIVLKEVDTDRLRCGYVCLKCWEPHEKPFPEQCSLCGYKMKENQINDLKRIYKGKIKLNANLHEELDRLDALHEQNIWVPKNSVIISKKWN